MTAARRLYLTGADGLLGSALHRVLEDGDGEAAGSWAVTPVSAKDFDIVDRAAVTESITRARPEVVVHAAAHAIVDDCERDAVMAMKVNAAGVHNVVQACRQVGARLVYISSDYVFDGQATPVGGYREEDVPNPLSVYGLTKLAGERIASTLPDHLVVRTSWLFGGTDENVDQVLALVLRSRAGVGSRLIADQVSLPTYTVDLARALRFLISRPVPPTGVVHVANAGTASWLQVGRHVLDLLDAELPPQPISLAEAGFVGTRPVDSTLSTERLARLGWTMPTWQDAVERFVGSLPAPVASGAR